MKDDVFRFDDFLKEKNESKIDSKDIRKIFEESEEVSTDSEKDHSPSKEDLDELMSAHEDDDFEKNMETEDETGMESEEEETGMESEEEETGMESEEEVEKTIEIKESTDNYYKLYSDKSEDFICDISIEGANPKETEARIVVESEDWTLMFSGELKNGKCVVPIKKLNILKEGQVGNIRLEVIAEGNLFIPWEDKFKVKLSKKVTVRVNEQKENPKKVVKKGVDVKVKVNK